MNTTLLRRGAFALTAAAVAASLVACGGGSDLPTAVGTAAAAKIAADPISGKLQIVAPNAQENSIYSGVGVSGNKSIGVDIQPKTSTVYTTSFCGIANFNAAMLAAVNAARASARTCGTTVMPAVGPLANNDQLISASSRHSLDMAKVMKLDHTGSDGSSPYDRITAAGYTWGDAGENVAWNQRSIPEVIESWLKSPGHCANIMNGDRTEFGAACEKASDGSFYWTQLFAAPQQ